MRNYFTLLILLITALTAKSSLAATENQTDWSGGPGVWGPVLSWGSEFSSCLNVNWFDPAGMLESQWIPLDAPIEHPVSGLYEGALGLSSMDLDGDGDLDVLSTNGSAVHWWANGGGGTNWDIRVIDPECIEASAVSFGCIDDDPHVDVLANDHWGINWYENDGIGAGWVEHTVDEAFYHAGFIITGDIDGDLDIDVVAAQDEFGNGDISWWANEDGGASWSERPLIGPPYYYVTSIHIADLDGDGDPDVLVSYSEDGTGWFENLDGSGTFGYHEICLTFTDARSVFAADIDGDADQDVLGASGLGNRVAWWENLDGSGTSWQEHAIEDSLSGASSVYSCDLDEDGDNDVIAVASGADCVVWLENVDGVGSSWIEHMVDDTFPGAFRLESGDFDGDGTTDIAGMASGTAVTHSITWWKVMGYSATAILTSSVLDVQEPPEWQYLDWSGIEPYGTDIELQVRASKDAANMGAWSSSLIAPDSLGGILSNGDSLFQYRVILSTTDPYLTPVLQDLEVSWSTCTGIENDEPSSSPLFGAHPNPSPGSVSIIVPPAFIPDAEILVYDISGKLIRRFTDIETNVVHWDCCGESGREVPSGVYIIQGISEEQTLSLRLVKI
ncbi:MAG: hypothetical protein AVO35_05650 [Candidatus Aegiribacteria sp. MLS_C]|nr:MAG: hypothetical protein AVO35_05650 [Candidatus Aegiribacteria sp. MLS_C]